MDVVAHIPGSSYARLHLLGAFLWKEEALFN